MIQGQLKIASTLVPHYVFRGNRVCVGSWSPAQAARSYRALAAGGHHRWDAAAGSLLHSVTFIPPGKTHAE